jgi:type IV pilus assembly protein PilV
MHRLLRLFIKKNTGFTLIEVLIAMLVLAVGLLGLAGFQVFSLRNNQSAYNRSQATQLAYDMADKIRANPAEANNLASSTYALTSAAILQTSCNSSPGCTPALMAQNDRALWNTNIISALGSFGAGSITVDPATKVFTITINWDDDRDSDADANDPNFQMSFQL